MGVRTCQFSGKTARSAFSRPSYSGGGCPDIARRCGIARDVIREASRRANIVWKYFGVKNKENKKWK
jgi:hypothetical protein